MLDKAPSSSKIESMDSFELAQDTFYSVFDRLWYRLNPGKLGSFLLASSLILGSGLAINGNWLLVYVAVEKQFENGSRYLDSIQLVSEYVDDRVNGRFRGLAFNIIASILAGYAVYFPICCFVHWYFYLRQRDRPHLWKCQPRKFLTWKDERHAITSGISVLTMVSTVSGVLSCYVSNGGYSTLYYRVSERGWLFYFLSIPVVTLFTELNLYYAHRAMHWPFMYRTIHKWHHRYKQPTPFAATAMHPLEMLTYQFFIFLPIFIVPVHWTVFIGNVLYMYYYNVLAHSGVKLQSMWPWQPSTLFHDNHHQYFHVNFGFNLDIWDKLHGTYRVRDRIYNEETFFGYGKTQEVASEAEIQEHQDNIVDDH